ncbi:MAG: hypothetical protein PHR82_04945 [Endomicrobiaceae bacterium]|nr:hypothetical protein [Endomicrobiaceae bacterium]
MQLKFFLKGKKNGDTKTTESCNACKFKKFKHIMPPQFKKRMAERTIRRSIAIVTNRICIFVLRFTEKIMPKTRDVSPTMPIISVSMSPPVLLYE